MKKMNKKGFTIVELVIVIAVIAILAAVMIPTFSGIVERANNSAVTQETREALTAMLIANDGDLSDGTYYFAYQKDAKDAEKWFKYENGKLNAVSGNAPTVTTADTIYSATNTPDIIEVKEVTGENAAKTTVKVLADLSSNVEILFVAQ